MSYAPGKLMIAGEYSVLFGGKSLVAACNNYQAIAKFKASSKWSFFARTNASYINHNEHKLFVAAQKAALNLGITPKVGAYYLDTSVFYNPQSKNKLGLGSSAAGTTALSKLFLAQAGVEDRQTLLRLALAAHKNFSGEIGSGADIAAATYETLIEFYNTPQGPHIKPIELSWWPASIWIDTGRPQNTRTFVAQVLSTAQKDPAFIKQFVEESNFYCSELQASKSPEQTVLLITNLYILLKKLSLRCKLNIISAEHRAIHELALSLGGSAKPSGAGGGDLSIAWVPITSTGNFIESIGKLGFQVLSKKSKN